MHIIKSNTRLIKKSKVCKKTKFSKRCSKRLSTSLIDYNSNQSGGTIYLDTLFDMFSVNVDDKEYFKNAFYDAIGLYSTVDWTSKTRYKLTYNDKNNNDKSIISLNNEILPVKKYKNNKGNEHEFNITKIVSSSNSKNKYIFIGTLLHEQIYRVVIFQKTDTNEFIVLLRYGKIFNPYEPKYIKIINNFSKFIISKIAEINIDLTSSKILLYGHSMGGILAQHIMLYFTKNKLLIPGNLFLVSSGTSDTVNEDDFQLFETILRGHYISIGLIMINPFNTNNVNTNKMLTVPISKNDIKDTIKDTIIDLFVFSQYNKLQTINTALIQFDYNNKYSILTILNIKDIFITEEYKENIHPMLTQAIHEFHIYRNVLFKLLE